MPEQTSTPIGDLPDPRAGHPDRARVATASPLPIGALSAFATPNLEALVADAVGILQQRGADLAPLRDLLGDRAFASSADAEAELGRVAFDAYAASVNGTTHDGRPIPTWEEVGDTVRDGWAAAATAVAGAS